VLQIGEVQERAPGAGEVRIRLEWSGVNPSDVKSRRGGIAPMPFPRVIPHSDGAGVIDQVGEGVDRARIGERVWVWNAAWGRPDGTAAEFVVLPAQQAVRLPDGVDPAAGACLGIPALTALHAVKVDGGVAERTVLVAGGAGAVGHYAIQFARLAGARQIIATVSNEEKAKLARSAGADAVINYRDTDMAQSVLDATNGTGVDRIIEVDLAANITMDIRAVRANGDIVVYGSGAREIPVPFGPSILKNIRYRFFIVYNLTDEDRRTEIEQLTKMLESNQLQHNIAERLPLSEIAKAHTLVEEGRALGNVVLEVGG
jgi:NADPH2:quinone reductase